MIGQKERLMVGRPARLAMVLAATFLVASSNEAATAPRAGPDIGPPNIVLILTDDQRWDTLWAMPNVQSELVNKGITFTNAFVVNALCCPSRSTILTGQYSHTTGVYSNSGPHGGFHAFNDRSTVATWIHDAGYRTALVGKYLNGYVNGPYIPPGWDKWAAFSSRLNEENNPGGGYYDYTLSVDGMTESHGSDVRDYSTDVLAGHAADFISSTPPGQPLFLEFAPRAPHGPATPAPRHLHAFPNLPPWRPPSYYEPDVSDKPMYIQHLPLPGPGSRPSLDRFRKDEYRTLLAVDDAVGTIIDRLTETGRLSNTLIMFASDNGLTWGEHRLAAMKEVPYEESIRIPLVVRYDALIQGPRTDDHLVANLDFAPTFADVARVGPVAEGVEGRSLVHLLKGPPPQWRGAFLVEHILGSAGIPGYCAVRDREFTYVAYQTKEEELYDLRADPFELLNVAGDPAYAARLDRMRMKLLQLCNPPPPGDPVVP